LTSNGIPDAESTIREAELNVRANCQKEDQKVVIVCWQCCDGLEGAD